MSFLRDWSDYASQDEAPETFHLLAAYTALSGAIGRRVWLLHGENALYCNIFSLLVGTAGCGKNQAINKCSDILARLKNVAISASVETPEGLIRYIAGNPTANPPVVSECEHSRMWRDGFMRDTHEIVIFATEFIDFIRINPTVWTGLLNNIYDKDVGYSYRTKGCGTDTIVGPYVVLLGGIPTDVSKQLQEINIINSGLARRTLLQYGERKYHDPHPFPEFAEKEKAAQERCLERLRKIQTFSGELKLTLEARQWWIDWYCKHSTTLLARTTPETQGWLSSKPMQVQKLAMLNSLSERDDLLITPFEFEVALAVLSEMEKGFNMIFGGVGRNELAGLSVQVFEYLRTRPVPVTFEFLISKFFHQFTAGKGVSELQEVLKYLKMTEQVIDRQITIANLTSTYWTTPENLVKFLAAHAQAAPSTPTSSPLDSPPATGQADAPA